MIYKSPKSTPPLTILKYKVGSVGFERRVREVMGSTPPTNNN